MTDPVIPPLLAEINATPGNTPLGPADFRDIIPAISTRAELNEFERANILTARDWAFKSAVLRINDPLDEIYIRKLHEKMFDEVWKWAGQYRMARGTELNFGCRFYEIPQKMKALVDDSHYWVENKTFPLDESIMRFHHRLVWEIHAFPNGNGRHARLLCDVIAEKFGGPEKRFTWGAGADLGSPGSPARIAYIDAMKALDANQNDVGPLLKFARS